MAQGPPRWGHPVVAKRWQRAGEGSHKPGSSAQRIWGLPKPSSPISGVTAPPEPHGCPETPGLVQVEPPRPAVPVSPCRSPCAHTGTPRCPACPRPPGLVSFPHFPEPPAEEEAAEPSELLLLHNLPRAIAGSRWHPPWQGLRGLVRLGGHPEAVPAPGRCRGQVSGAARGQAGQGLGSLGTNWVAPRCHSPVCGAGALQPPAAWGSAAAPERRLAPHGPIGGRWGFGAAHRGWRSTRGARPAGQTTTVAGDEPWAEHGAEAPQKNGIWGGDARGAALQGAPSTSPPALPSLRPFFGTVPGWQSVGGFGWQQSPLPTLLSPLPGGSAGWKPLVPAPAGSRRAQGHFSPVPVGSRSGVKSGLPR